MIDQEYLNLIIRLRSCVGYLGEQSRWWKGNFFSPSSIAFLKPIFHKTFSVAIYQGVKNEASLIHDEHIGNGAGVYHLFRLPETLEIDLLKTIKDEPGLLLTDKGQCIEFLSNFKMKSPLKKEGPVFIDKVNGISNIENWKLIASIYSESFKSGKSRYPFFARGER